ncbi:hypothetical protein PhCBS80983_g05002 [Powellomyces hirtus]|uniref:beta-aspartyl-peptidase n=1 Tax=Powellomyces hirtus TaxID=109895 RepID=A0A507DXB2_9FUNG|nr:hypothetical protein PhCBS80983_g05002 [Powellomyces hirtus]
MFFGACLFGTDRPSSCEDIPRANGSQERSHTSSRDDIDGLMNHPSQNSLVIHGGAGVLIEEDMSAEQRKTYVAALRNALLSGFGALRAGGTSLEATETAVRVLEDCPLFNAGKGAVFSRDGENVCEASIMDGRTHAAGAVTLLRTVKNPISLARVVKDEVPHVFIAATEAEAFAAKAGLDIVDPSYFYTEHRWKQHLGEFSTPDVLSKDQEGDDVPPSYWVDPYPRGTVGACAVDIRGDLAAATSTGGMNNKWSSRIGDTPMISCGTYAENKVAAVSGTGNGEFFIRYAVAHDIIARMKYGKVSLAEAADATIHDTMKNAGGDGGVVAVDAQGKVAMPYNTSGMFRGFIKDDGVPHVAIWDEWY